MLIFYKHDILCPERSAADLGEGELDGREVEIANRITPGDILALITGSDEEPLKGFKPKPSINFDLAAEATNKTIPEISACSNSITFFQHPWLRDPAKFCKLMITVYVNGTIFSAA